MEFAIETAYHLFNSFNELEEYVGSKATMELMETGFHQDADFNDGTQAVSKYSLEERVVEDENGNEVTMLQLEESVEYTFHWEE